MKPVPPRSAPRKACSSFFPRAPRPRPGLPPRWSASPCPGAPAISTPQRSRSAQPRTCSRPCPRTWLPATASCALRYCPAAAWWNSGGAVSMRLTRPSMPARQPLARQAASMSEPTALGTSRSSKLSAGGSAAWPAEAPPADLGEDRLPGPVSPAAEVALACVHTERNELSRARCQLKQADEALLARPDRLVSAAACLVAARRSLAEGRPGGASQLAGRARDGWSPPAWLDHRLTLVESRACAARSDIRSAVDLAASAGPGTGLDAAI